jgi:hypothetical protein
MTAQATPHGITAMIVSLAICGVLAKPAAAEEASARPAEDRSRAEPARPITYLPALRANVSNTERYVVDGICEREGVRQIAQILRYSDVEEMWAFLPRANGTAACEWHEVGREEKSGKDSARLRVDLAYLGRLMAANAELHIYHFHPLKYFECASDPDCPQTSAPGETGLFDRRWITDLVYSMPSASDVYFMMDTTLRFYRRYQHGGTMKHKVVTPYGVVDYGLTARGLAKFDTERFGRSEGLYIAWVQASRLADDRIEEMIRDGEGNILDAVQRLAQRLNSEFLWLSYGAFNRQPQVIGDK